MPTAPGSQTQKTKFKDPALAAATPAMLSWGPIDCIDLQASPWRFQHQHSLSPHQGASKDLRLHGGKMLWKVPGTPPVGSVAGLRPSLPYRVPASPGANHTAVDPGPQGVKRGLIADLGSAFVTVMPLWWEDPIPPRVCVRTGSKLCRKDATGVQVQPLGPSPSLPPPCCPLSGLEVSVAAPTPPPPASAPPRLLAGSVQAYRATAG